MRGEDVRSWSRGAPWSRIAWHNDTPVGGVRGRWLVRGTGTVAHVAVSCVVNSIVPFSTRLADDGLMHVRAWHTGDGPLLLVGEFDWPVQVADPADGYSGPGIFTYPHHALPAALAACVAMGPDEPEIIVRLPAPPGQRYLRVIDADDPQGWVPLDEAVIHSRVGSCAWPGPGVGHYLPAIVQRWIDAGAPPPA